MGQFWFKYTLFCRGPLDSYSLVIRHLHTSIHREDKKLTPSGSVGYLFLMETALIIYSMVIMYNVVDCEWNGLLFQEDYTCPGDHFANEFQGLSIQFMIDNVMRTNALLTVLISTAVQWSMAWRVRVLSRSNLLGAFIAIISSISLGFGIATYTQGTRVMAYVGEGNERQNSYDFPFVWLLSSAIADTIIAISFITRSRTGFKKTDGMLMRMTQLLVGAGSLTAILTVLDAALFFHGMLHYFEDKFTPYTIPEFLLSKLYTNSLLATLNARIVWRNSSSEGQSGSEKGSGLMPSFRITQEMASSTSVFDTPRIGQNAVKQTSSDEGDDGRV
ncbi:hypothetical protein ONZ45_g15490 [Pleurotus djamor]|nr:hypothetical protein ONZ45_g15490 [Pleurotus djamor]